MCMSHIRQGVGRGVQLASCVLVMTVSGTPALPVACAKRAHKAIPSLCPPYRYQGGGVHRAWHHGCAAGRERRRDRPLAGQQGRAVPAAGARAGGAGAHLRCQAHRRWVGVGWGSCMISCGIVSDRRGPLTVPLIGMGWHRELHCECWLVHGRRVGCSWHVASQVARWYCMENRQELSH